MLRNILAFVVAGTVVIGGAGFMAFGFYYWGLGFAFGLGFGILLCWFFLKVHYGVDIGQMIDRPNDYWLVRRDRVEKRRASDAPIDAAGAKDGRTVWDRLKSPPR